MKNNWQTKTLGEVCEIVNGGTPKTNVGAYWDGDIQWITPKDMGKMRSPFVAVTERQITEAGLKNSSAKVLPPNSIILSSRAPIGHLAINQAPMTTNQGCKGLIPNKTLDVNFLYNFLWVSKDLLNDLGSGTTFKELSGTKLKEVQIPFPPLPEQRRIVAILDDVFERTAKAKANAEKNLANAREVFESYLQKVFAEPGKEWEIRQLGDKTLLEIIDGDRGKNYPSKADFSDEGFCVFMNTKNVRPDGFDFATKMFITEKKDNILGNGKLQRNDVILTTRGTIGNLGLYDSSVPYDNIRINSGMLIFRPNVKTILPEYLFEILRSGIIKNQITRFVSGAAQPQLPIKTLVSFSFPMPTSLQAQRVIVKNLKFLSSETKQLEAIYRQKLSSLEELKKSVLRSAFRGEL